MLDAIYTTPDASCTAKRVARVVLDRTCTVLKGTYRLLKGISMLLNATYTLLNAT